MARAALAQTLMVPSPRGDVKAASMGLVVQFNVVAAIPPLRDRQMAAQSRLDIKLYHYRLIRNPKSKIQNRPSP
jgi:hypothetical protein